MIHLPSSTNDNLDYIKNIERITQNRIDAWTPSDVYITRIDNWFDNKWIKFSGTQMHAISIWKEGLTIPPFHPNRVDSCDFYQKTESEYKKILITNPLHVFQESSKNLKRKTTDFSDNGLFIWFSGNSLLNGKGSLMGYFVKGDDYFTFYLVLTAAKDWKPDKVIGLTLNEVEKMIAAELNLT